MFLVEFLAEEDGTQAQEDVRSQCLGQYVCRLLLRSDPLKFESAVRNEITNIVKAHVDVLGALTQFGTLGEGDCSTIVAVEWSRGVGQHSTVCQQAAQPGDFLRGQTCGHIFRL